MIKIEAAKRLNKVTAALSKSDKHLMDAIVKSITGLNIVADVVDDEENGGEISVIYDLMKHEINFSAAALKSLMNIEANGWSINLYLHNGSNGLEFMMGY